MRIAGSGVGCHSNGGINNNNGGITNTGAVSGVTNLTGTGVGSVTGFVNGTFTGTVSGATGTFGTLNATTGNIATLNSTTINNTGATNTGSLAVTNNATVGGTLAVTGVTSTNGITNTGTIASTGNITSGGTVQGATVTSTGATNVGTNLAVGGNATVGGTLTANGPVQVNNSLTVAAGQTVSMGGNRVQNVATPVAGTDAVNKNYVDAADTALNNRINGVFKKIDENTQGIAIAIAMGGVMLPQNKNFVIGANVGFYDGKQAVAGSAAVRLNETFTVHGSVGAGLSGGSSVGGRVGFQAAF